MQDTSIPVVAGVSTFQKKKKKEQRREIDFSREIPERCRRGKIRALHLRPMVWPCEHKELAPIADSVPVEDKRAHCVSE